MTRQLENYMAGSIPVFDAHETIEADLSQLPQETLISFAARRD